MYIGEIIMIQKALDELNIPSLLTFKNGKKVTTLEGFERRREELKDILQKEVYGYLPPKPAHLKVEETGDEGERFCAGFATCRHLKFHCEINGEDATFPVHHIMPNGVEKAPVFVLISFGTELFQRYIPMEEIVQRGYGLCVIFYQDVAKDSADFRSCMAKYLCKSRRALTAPGKIAMWAWAAHRVMDYAQTLGDVLDLECGIVCGHSRLGKTALLTGATDERFKFAYSNDSGCSGAAITRQKGGETVEKICNKFSYWFCENYLKYINNEDSMPFDQHYLLSSVAPRFACVGSASEDLWADPVSEMLNCVASSSAFKNGFVYEDRLPEIGDHFFKGDISNWFSFNSGKRHIEIKDFITILCNLICITIVFIQFILMSN